MFALVSLRVWAFTCWSNTTRLWKVPPDSSGPSTVTTRVFPSLDTTPRTLSMTLPSCLQVSSNVRPRIFETALTLAIEPSVTTIATSFPSDQGSSAFNTWPLAGVRSRCRTAIGCKREGESPEWGARMERRFPSIELPDAREWRRVVGLSGGPSPPGRER